MLNGSAQLVIEGGEFCLTTPYKKRLMSANRLLITALCGAPSAPLRQADDAASRSSHPAVEGWLFGRKTLRCEQALGPADEVVGEVACDDSGDDVGT